MLAAVALAREILKRNTSEDVAWKVLLKHRWSEDVKDPCLKETQIGEIIQKVKSELDLNYSLQSCTQGDELALGLEFYIALNSCQDSTEEANQIFVFFKSLLLSNQSLSTKVAAMHNIQPRVGNKIKDLTAMNMGFQLLDSRYKFSLGSAILPLFNTVELEKLEQLEPPFMDDYLETIPECRNGNQCKDMMFGKLDSVKIT